MRGSSAGDGHPKRGLAYVHGTPSRFGQAGRSSVSCIEEGSRICIVSDDVTGVAHGLSVHSEERRRRRFKCGLSHTRSGGLGLRQSSSRCSSGTQPRTHLLDERALLAARLVHGVQIQRPRCNAGGTKLTQHGLHRVSNARIAVCASVVAVRIVLNSFRLLSGRVVVAGLPTRCSPCCQLQSAKDELRVRLHDLETAPVLKQLQLVADSRASDSARATTATTTGSSHVVQSLGNFAKHHRVPLERYHVSAVACEDNGVFAQTAGKVQNSMPLRTAHLCGDRFEQGGLRSAQRRRHPFLQLDVRREPGSCHRYLCSTVGPALSMAVGPGALISICATECNPVKCSTRVRTRECEY
jgi:hypothetical protein